MTVTVTTHWPVDPDVRLSLDGQPPSAVVDELARDPAVVDAVIDAVGRAKAAIPVGQEAAVADVLRAAGVDALDGAYADGVAALAATDVQRRRRVPRYPVDMTAAFGGGAGPAGLVQPLAEWADGPAALLDAAEASLQVVVELLPAFRDQRRDQREKILRNVLAPLAHATGVDVRIVTTLGRQRWLAETHAGDLPGVREACSLGDDQTDPDAVAAAAAGEVVAGDRAARVLAAVADRPTETADYDALADDIPGSRSTLRGAVGTLVDLGLLRRVGSRTDPRFELTAGGRQFFDDEIAVQRRLGDRVREPGNSSGDSRVTPRAHGQGESGGDGGDGAAGTPWLDRATTAAALGTARDGAVTLIDTPVTQWDRGERGWPEPHLSVQPAREEGVVAVEAVSPLQWLTSAALASWGPRARSRLWDDAARDRLDDALNSESWALQRIRTMGYLGEDVADAADWLDALGEAATDLRELTRRLGTGEYDDRDRLRGEIMRLAHGLVGIAAQAADLAEIDLVWQLRLPECSRNWGADRRRELAQTVAQSLVIQSSYAGHTAWRHLVEPRERKRQQTPAPEIDAADPTARLLTSLVVVGDGVTRFGDNLADALAAVDAAEHDDAPEFAADIPVRSELTESDWRDVLRRACRPKRLQPRTPAVRTARALVDSPTALADAVTRSLASADARRELRADELRTALQTLPADRLLPDTVPTVRRVVAALLHVNGYVTETTLSDAADVSRRSLRTHRETLRQLGLVETASDGRLRLRLAATPDDDAAWPRPVAEDWTGQDAAFALAQALLDPDDLSDPTHDMIRRLHDPDRIVTPTDLAPDWPFVDRWVRYCRAVSGRDPPDAGRRHRVGSIDQTALDAAGGDRDAVAGGLRGVADD